MSAMTLIESLETIARKIGAFPPLPSDAYGDPREELIVRYSIGQGRFSADGKYINIQTKMYKFNGEPDGHHESVDQPIFNSVFDTFNRPDPPKPPFDSPEGPVEHVGVLSHAKGHLDLRRRQHHHRIRPRQPALRRLQRRRLAVLGQRESDHHWRHGPLRRRAGPQDGRRFHLGPERHSLNRYGAFSSKTVEVFRVVRREFVQA
jgi:hypothetical protein